MSILASTLKIPEPTASPAARWTSAARLAAAGTLVLGAGLQLAANSIGAQTGSTLDAAQWVVDHPDLANLANLASVSALLSVPFFLGTALVYVLLPRQRSPRLAYTTGILLGCGFVGLSAVEGYEALALAQDGRFNLTVLAEVVDEMSSPPRIAMMLTLLPFFFIGLLTSAVALWRSGAVPRAAVFLILAFILVDFFLHEQLGVVPAFAGPAIWFVAACWIASAVLLARRAVLNLGRAQKGDCR
jgi:hypothetical protein